MKERETTLPCCLIELADMALVIPVLGKKHEPEIREAVKLGLASMENLIRLRLRAKERSNKGVL